MQDVRITGTASGKSSRNVEAHNPAADGGHIVAPPPYVSDDVAKRRDREAKPCTHISEQVAVVVSKFGVDLI